MAYSDGSTVPNTPESDSGEAVKLDEEQVFAWLRPLNDTAHKAFDATVNTVIKHSPEFDHFRQFLHSDSRMDRSQSVYTEDENSSHEQPLVPLYQWVGAYALRLTNLPRDPFQGWCLGTNCARSPLNGVDLLLAPPRNYRTETQIDISPGNLAVTSLNEPKGIILDLDAATRSVSSTDHMKGTLPYLAPEIMALKNWDGSCKQPPPYEKSIDTWALGLIMYALYTGQHFDWAFFGATTSGPVATVTPKAFTNFQDKTREVSSKHQELRGSARSVYDCKNDRVGKNGSEFRI